jgi:hypothetical protein
MRAWSRDVQDSVVEAIPTASVGVQGAWHALDMTDAHGVKDFLKRNRHTAGVRPLVIETGTAILHRVAQGDAAAHEIRPLLKTFMVIARKLGYPEIPDWISQLGTAIRTQPDSTASVLDFLADNEAIGFLSALYASPDCPDTGRDAIYNYDLFGGYAGSVVTRILDADNVHAMKYAIDSARQAGVESGFTIAQAH